MSKQSRPVFCEIPKQSVLFAEKADYDWFDAYQVSVADPEHALTPRKLCELFLDVTPCWVIWLFALRNFLARLVGLHGVSARKGVSLCEYFDSLPLNEGDVVEKVDVFTHNERELVVGMSDWHLAFKGSLFLSEAIPESGERTVVITTVVRFRHVFGRLYFLPVKPFHKQIVKSLLRRLVASHSGRLH